MSTKVSVDVFLGHPLVDTNEKLFLARLRRDLVAAGVNARILANAQVGKDFLELDFVVVTRTRAAVIELKAWRDPVVARPNGRWQRIVEGQAVDADGNPYRQAAGYGFALSDEMRAYARASGAPGPTKDKFVKDLDLLVCMYPEVRAGSTVQNPQHVHLLGYGGLLDRLIRPGRVPAWSADDWDGFIRHLGLYRDDEDSDSAVAHRQSAAIADEYAARFAAARRDLPPVVATSVRHDGTDTARPDLAAALLAGRDVVLWGPRVRESRCGRPRPLASSPAEDTCPSGCPHGLLRRTSRRSSPGRSRRTRPVRPRSWSRAPGPRGATSCSLSTASTSVRRRCRPSCSQRSERCD